ncbi:MAG: PQQ-dependent sugar dehydrogenase, partial [archaeon]
FFKNNFFFGALRGEGLVRVVFDANDPDKITLVEKLKEVQFGRIREVAEGPDGALYFSTSNSNAGPGQTPVDKIFRLRAK